MWKLIFCQGGFTIEIINAYKCSIKHLLKSEEESFLRENHPTDHILKSTISYGLFYHNELIKSVSFGIPRFDSNYQWELLIDCTKEGYKVINGLSLIWEQFLKENKPYDCVVYSYPSGKSYTPKYINSCGFKNIVKSKNIKGVLSPQIDSWFCGGCVYRMEIIGTDKFYIGQTMQNIEEYWGSGGEWNRYLDYNNIPRDDKHIKKIVLKDDFNNRKELFKYEFEEISKYLDKDRKDIAPEHKNKMLNQFISEQWPGNFASCTECGGKNNHHKIGCSKARLCTECGGFLTSHKKTCSRYTERSACPECGSKTVHKKTCSRYKQVKCGECGVIGGNHKKTCSRYVQPKNLCQYCKTPPGGKHKKDCPNFKPVVCSECGGKSNMHKKSCSKYKPNICQECGGVNSHKDYCSKSKCKPCSECGGKHGVHKRDCSKAKICNECGAVNGNHKASCSRHKPLDCCSECGGKGNRHRSYCSKYKKPNVCQECGTPYNRHKSTCSKAKLCPECGANEGKHFSSCSKYKYKH